MTELTVDVDGAQVLDLVHAERIGLVGQAR